MTQTINQYRKAFEAQQETRKDAPSWLLRLREEAMASFERKGFPTLRDNAWRYTDLTPLLEAGFDPDLSSSGALSQEKLEVFKTQSGRYQAVVINGKFSREHSTLPCEITVMDLEEAIRTRPDLVEPYLGRGRIFQGEAFPDLNLAFFRSGLLIHVAENVTVKEPLRVVYVSGTPEERTASFVRNLVVMEAGSKVALGESYLSENRNAHLTNVVTEVFLAQGYSGSREDPAGRSVCFSYGVCLCVPARRQRLQLLFSRREAACHGRILVS